MKKGATQKGKSLMRRRVIAIIATVLATIILIGTLVWVLDYVKTTTFVDVDGSKYYIRYRDKSYAMYDTSKKHKLDTDSEKGYYITDAGTLVEVDAETGEYTVQAVVDTEGNEVVGFNSRLLLFPHIEKKNIRSLEVHNDKGTFAFDRFNPETNQVDNTSDFVIRNSILTSFDQELFASLYVSAGYTISTRKIQDPIKDANGNFSEYGLVPEERVNDDGETYAYTPAYYILTDTSGNRYKVLIGDRLVTGGGYYVQYVDMSGETEVPRQAVYVLSSDISESLLAPIEDYVTPLVCYPMSMNNYFDVEDFMVLRHDDGKTKMDGFSYGYEETVSFTYIDLTERENTINASVPYVFNKGSSAPAASLAGYSPSSNNINTCLQALYNPSFAGVRKLSPSDADFVRYGLAKEVPGSEEGKVDYEFCPEYILSFKFDVTDDGDDPYTIRQLIMISQKNEDGNYYAFTTVYDDKGELLYDYNMIVEVEGHTFEFLNWDSYDWIESGYVNLNIAFCASVKLEAPGYTAEFILDNSASDSSETISSNLMTVSATDSNGNSRKTFANLTVTDKSGNIWVITATDIKAYNAAGTELKITTSKYDYNVMGTQVLIVSGYIECRNGDQVEVGTDLIRIRHVDGSVEEIVRYDTNLFRRFYQTLLYASIVDSYPMSDEDRDALLNDSGKLLLTMTIKTTEGEEKVYRFYELTSRKAYITINGNGGFYVLRNRVAKFVSDAQRFFALEMIDATGKN